MKGEKRKMHPNWAYWGNVIPRSKIMSSFVQIQLPWYHGVGTASEYQIYVFFFFKQKGKETLTIEGMWEMSSDERPPILVDPKHHRFGRQPNPCELSDQPMLNETKSKILGAPFDMDGGDLVNLLYELGWWLLITFKEKSNESREDCNIYRNGRGRVPTIPPQGGKAMWASQEKKGGFMV